MTTHTSSLVVVGTPLLDLVVMNGEPLLEKYRLKSNDAILAGPEHSSIYEDILESYEPVVIPGGDANIARAAAYVLPKDDTAFIGSVGADSRGTLLMQANEKEGVKNAVYVEEGEETGVCAVVIQSNNRSLVTDLCAAKHFRISHLEKPNILSLLRSARHVYVSGYFLPYAAESALQIAKIAENKQQFLTLNLAAPYIAQVFRDQLDQILPYADFVIGNESEAVAWAAARQNSTDDLAAIAAEIVSLPKQNKSRPRIVIITHGADPTIVVSSDAPTTPKIYPIIPVATADIVDTNGAGDAFAGGFLGALVLGKSLDEAIEAGHRLGAMCIRQIGAQLKWPKEIVF